MTDEAQKIRESNREHAQFIRRRLIQLSDEPCATCGRPAGDLRVLEGIAHTIGKTTLPARAICEPCFREQNGMQRPAQPNQVVNALEAAQ